MCVGIHVNHTGSARAFDQNAIIHGIWKRAAELRTEMWIERVDTQMNIADDPSRERYTLLDRMKARRVTAVLDEVFQSPQTWESLSILGMR